MDEEGTVRPVKSGPRKPSEKPDSEAPDAFVFMEQLWYHLELTQNLTPMKKGENPESNNEQRGDHRNSSCPRHQ